MAVHGVPRFPILFLLSSGLLLFSLLSMKGLEASSKLQRSLVNKVENVGIM
jgi:hypothetical protein